MSDLRHAILVALALGVSWSCGHVGDQSVTDLIHEYPQAQKSASSNLIEAFSVSAVSINGVTRSAILVHPKARAEWRVPVNDSARFRAFVALTESSWGVPGYGVLFRVEVGDAGHYQEVLSRPVNPRRFPQDRSWIPVDVDLGRFVGRTVEIVLDADPRSDASVIAAWGEPRIEYHVTPGSSQ